MEANEDVWELWQFASGQWRIGGMGVPIGLDYGAVKIVADAVDIPLDHLTLVKIGCLEAEALSGFDDKSREARIRKFCEICQEAKRNLKCEACDLGGIK